MFQILDLDVTIPHSDYKQNLDNFLSGFGNQNMSSEIKEISTRQGKTVYKTEIINNDNKDSFEIIAEKDPSSGDIIMKPLEFTNMQNGYFAVNVSDSDNNGTYDDPSFAFSSFIIDTCSRLLGNLALINPNGSLSIIKDGIRKSGKIAAIDNDGNLYGGKEGKRISASSNNSFTVNVPLNVWLADAEQLSLQPKIQSAKSPTEKADLIGKYLLFKKLKGEIDFDEFYDIFRQPGMLIGYGDKELQTIYKLIM